MAVSTVFSVDTHRLRYFLKIAEEGSISRAAVVLGIAQPALSRQVRLLEDDLGVTLFQRTARGVRLTEDGEQLRATTTAPLRQLEMAMQYIGSPLARVQRGLHLGMPAGTAGVLAGPLLAGLGAAFPRVDLRLTVGPTEDLVERMLRGAVDISVICPFSDGRLYQHQLAVEDLVVVGPPASGLRPDRTVEFRELADLPLILPISAAGIRTSLENTALRLEIGLRTVLATDCLQTTKEMVLTDYGYAVLPISACRREVAQEQIRYAPLGSPALTQELRTATTALLELPRGFSTKVGEIIREEARRLIAAGVWDARFTAPGTED
jgi:LysR family nitrogen assimilation transcriptional regulator